MSVLGLYWVCLSQWKLLCAMFLLTICRQSLVSFRIEECLHICGSGSHSSYVASELFLQDSLSVHAYIADLLANWWMWHRSLFLYYWVFCQMIDIMRAVLAMLVYRDIMHLFRLPVMAICRENQLLTLTDGYQNDLMTHRFRRGVVVANLRLKLGEYPGRTLCLKFLWPQFCRFLCLETTGLVSA